MTAVSEHIPADLIRDIERLGRVARAVDALAEHVAVEMLALQVRYDALGAAVQKPDGDFDERLHEASGMDAIYDCLIAAQARLAAFTQSVPIPERLHERGHSGFGIDPATRNPYESEGA